MLNDVYRFLMMFIGAGLTITYYNYCLSCRQQEKERAAEAAVYVGKPDLPPSWDGGGWAGPRDGHDKDQRYMLRGEATWLSWSSL